MQFYIFSEQIENGIFWSLRCIRQETFVYHGILSFSLNQPISHKLNQAIHLQINVLQRLINNKKSLCHVRNILCAKHSVLNYLFLLLIFFSF